MRQIRGPLTKAIVFYLFLILLVSAPCRAATSKNFEQGSYTTILTNAWYNISYNGAKAGFFHQKISQGADGFKLVSRAVIRLAVQGAVQDLSYSKTYYLDRNKDVVGFTSLQVSGVQRQQTNATVQKGLIVMTVDGVDGRRTIKKQIPENIEFIDTMAFRLVGRMKEGLTATVPVFIPFLRATTSLTYKVGKKRSVVVDGEKVDAYPLQVELQGVLTKSLITADGVSIREEDGMIGAVSELVTEEEALSIPKNALSISSLISFSLIKPNRPIIRQKYIRELHYSITGLSKPGLIPDNSMQTVGTPVWSNNSKGKRIMTLPVKVARFFPRKRLPIAKVMSMEPRFLLPSPEIQSDNKEILKLAQKIIGNEKDALRAAIKLNQWVFNNLQKKLADSFSALDALKAREGECQSHTNLFAALARSVGIPTKTVSGLMHSPQQKGFLYHAWPEVFVGQWYPLDPTFGQDSADPTHIKLTEGGPESSLKLLKFISKVSIQVGEYEAR